MEFMHNMNSTIQLDNPGSDEVSNPISSSVRPGRRRPRSIHRTMRRHGAGASAGLVAALLAGLAIGGPTGLEAFSDDESTFVPIAPCRLLDTRADAPLGVQDTQTFQVTGANGDCNIPNDAVAAAFNATATRATERSFATFFPADVARPLSSNLNYESGQPPLPNKIDVKLSDDGRVSIYNESGAVDMIVDITGYYIDSGTQDVTARLEALEAARPHIATTTLTDNVNLSVDAETVAEVSISSDVPGDVIVDVSGSVRLLATNGSGVTCSLGETAGVVDTSAEIRVEAPTVPSRSAMAGTRRFSTAGGTTTVAFVCDKFGGGLAIMEDIELNALFIAD